MCLPCLVQVASASAVRHLELGVKLSFKLYEQLGTVLATNSSLEVLSLAGSCCGDQALVVSSCDVVCASVQLLLGGAELCWELLW